MSLPGLLPIALTAVLVLAVWFDVRQSRIPNWLTVGGAVLGIALRSLIGIDAILPGLLGAMVGLLVGMSLFAIGAMGAGDGKLLAAVGSLLGFWVFLRALPLIAIAGGVLALVVTVRNGTLLPTLLRFRELALHIVSFGRIGERRTLATPGAITVPYGVAVAAGSVWGWLVWGLPL